MILNKKQGNKGNMKNNRKKKKLWKKILILILIIILVAVGWFIYKTQKNGGGVSGMLATVVGHDENTKKNLSEFRALILGISTDQTGVDLTDTIIVASYNPNTQKATLLSIPRDTYTGKNPSKATPSDKINALYSYTKGPEATLKLINEITGLNIDHYAVIKTEALIKLVDAIGGVDFNVPIDMDYDDETQDLHIHLKAGQQHLNSDQAEQLVRFRHNNDLTSYPEEYGDNDTGRMRTQREFIMQVLKQTLKPENIFKIGEILDIANQYVITNIDLDYAKDYIPYAVEFSTDNIVTGVLPGENTNKNTSGTWVFVHDQEETDELVQELFYDRDLEQETTEENTTEGNTINAGNSTNNTNTNTETSKVSKSDIKIEVLNGCGDGNKFQKAVEELENSGYEVSRTGNTNLTSKTTIVDKKETSQVLLNNLKDVLKIGTISNSELNSSSKVDVTIVIGKDYDSN